MLYCAVASKSSFGALSSGRMFSVRAGAHRF